MALAGGVTIEMPHGQGYLYQEGEILSDDGHCRAFDATRQGNDLRQRRRPRGLAAPRGRARRWRHGLRGRQGLGGQQRRRPQGRLPGAERRRPGRSRRRSAESLRGARRHDHLHRVSRHGNARGRSDRGRGAHARVPIADRPRRLLRARLGQDEHRSSRYGCRRRGLRQSRGNAAAPDAGAESPLQ